MSGTKKPHVYITVQLEVTRSDAARPHPDWFKEYIQDARPQFKELLSDLGLTLHSIKAGQLVDRPAEV